jgi:hypothetical protein
MAADFVRDGIRVNCICPGLEIYIFSWFNVIHCCIVYIIEQKNNNCYKENTGLVVSQNIKVLDLFKDRLFPQDMQSFFNSSST